MAGQGEHCAHLFLRCWRVACAQKFRCFLRSRDRGSEDAVVFAEIGGDGYFGHKTLQPFAALIARGEPAVIRPAPAPGPEPARPALRPRRWLSLAALVAVFALAGILSVHVGQQATHPDMPGQVTKPKDDPPKKPPLEPKKPPPMQHNATPAVGTVLALLALVVVLAALGWRRRRAKRGGEPATKPAEGSHETPQAVEQNIAIKLEAEILRRSALRRGDEHAS